MCLSFFFVTNYKQGYRDTNILTHLYPMAIPPVTFVLVCLYYVHRKTASNNIKLYPVN